ncbi:CHAT domain-containing protein [Chaetomium tenue]|uniref:CHAT domain-containing protein n=1 Tax=Chaetomium tenue TaxID=1854479 RepID=A0ACB7PQZ9_9PEZI|nr:CHAT domain-containing protein [Chaetomium globosum]
MEIIDQYAADFVVEIYEVCSRSGCDIWGMADVDLEQQAEQFVKITAKSHQSRQNQHAPPSLLYWMGYRLFETYRDEGLCPALDGVCTGLDGHVKLAVACCNAGLSLATNTAHRTVLLYRLPEMLAKLYETKGTGGRYLDQSLAISRELVLITTGPEGEDWQALRTEALEQTSTALEHRYAEKKEPRDLYEALHLCQEALRLTNDLTRQASLRSRLAEIHRRRFEMGWDLPLIDEAIREGTAVCNACRGDKDTLAQALSMLSGYHHSKYEHSHHPSDLESAVDIATRAVKLEPQPIPIRIECLLSRCVALGSRYTRDGNHTDMDDALKAGFEASNLAGKDTVSRVAISSTLAELYLVRNAREGQLSDAEEAGRQAKIAVALAPFGVAARLSALSIQLSAVCARYVAIPDSSIRDEAQDIANEIEKHTSEQDPTLGLIWINLGWLHHCRYRETENIWHLELAIDAARKAVNLILETSPIRADAEASLGGRLLGLYKRDRLEATLNEAIKYLKTAEARVPDSSSVKARHLGHLAAALMKRSDATNDKDKQDSDRKEALAMFKSAAANELGTPSDRIGCAQRAIEILVVQGKTSEAKALADEAMKLLPLACLRYTCKEDQQRAMMRIPGFASEAASLSLLANDVEKAVEWLELGRGVILGYTMDDAADLSTLRADHPDFVRRYESLVRRGSADQVEAYRNLALPVHLAEGWEETIQEHLQVASGVRDVIAAALGREQRQAAQDLNLCIEEIRKLEGHERFRMPLVPDDWKALASTGPIVMVNMSDIGRHAILITPKDVTAIELQDSRRDNATHRPQRVYRGPGQDRPTDRDIVDADSPQTDPGMERFSSLWTNCVRPVLEKLKKMGCLHVAADQAERGLPRVWWIGCGDASSLPFHAAGLDFNEGSANNALSIVSSYTPTLKALAYSRSRALRLSRYPHGGRDNKVVTSSIERSITSVLGSSNKSGSAVKNGPVEDETTRAGLTPPTQAPCAAIAGRTSTPESILLVTMPTTPGQRDLPGVNAESKALREACKDHYLIEELEHPTAAQVLDKFVDSTIVHFACHGFSDPVYPSNSRLMLQKNGISTSATTTGKKNKPVRIVVEDRLTLKDVSIAAFEAGGESRIWLAVLSACSTAETRAMWLADEGLHLAAGFQAAGFAHVVGTLWRAEDDACRRVTEHFYTYLNGEAAKKRGREAVVAEALWHAVMMLRKETGCGPDLWAPFVHFGV